MKKPLWALMLLMFSGAASAEWQQKDARWFNLNYFSMLQIDKAKLQGFIVTSASLDYNFLKVVLDASKLELKKDKPPYIVRGRVYFDGKAYADYRFEKGYNNHNLKGIEYDFPEDAFDADLYEKLKLSKMMTVEYQGKDKQKLKLDIPLDDYYDHFNRYSIARMGKFTPEFKTSEGEELFAEMINQCSSIADEKVEDIRAKQSGASRDQRQQQVLAGKKLSQSQADALKLRVAQAYAFVGEATEPEWARYQLFTECYNAKVHKFYAM